MSVPIHEDVVCPICMMHCSYRRLAWGLDESLGCRPPLDTARNRLACFRARETRPSTLDVGLRLAIPSVGLYAVL